MRFRPFCQTTAFLALAIALMPSILIGGWKFVDFVADMARDSEHRETRLIATTSTSAFEPSDVELLKSGDQNAYAPVRNELARLKQVLKYVKHVRILERKDGAFGMLAASDGSARDTLDLRFPDAAAVLHRAFDTATPQIVGPYFDTPEGSVTAVAPILDPIHQTVTAVAVYDFPAKAWLANVRSLTNFATAIAVLVVGLAGVFVTSLLIQRRHQLRVDRLNANLERQIGELAMANQIVENSTTILFRAEPETMAFTYISHNIEHYGYRSDALLHAAQRWRTLFHPEDVPLFEADIRQLMEGHTVRTRREIRLRKGTHDWVWFDGQLSAVRNPSQRVVAFEGLLFDISETKKAEERIQYLVNHDALTGLANRAAFLTRLSAKFAEAARGGSGFAVLYLDVDHFKDINEAFGEAKGDLFLKAVAERLVRISRDSDAVGRLSIARLGGDEFAILQTNVIDPSDAAALSQRLNTMLAVPFSINGNDVHATVSIGIALYDSSIAAPDDMLTQADLALYRAKDGGRNQYHFHSGDLDAKVRERVAIAEELHAALKNNELELYYQPQVEIPSGRIIGMEALMRWNHPQRGLVMPDVFIPVAEKTGIIVAMGLWAIGEACRQMQRWRVAGIAPPIMGVNVSAVQIRNCPHLDSDVEKILLETNMNPNALELELTESILIETTVSHNDIMHRLRKIGTRLAIDDFGTGYSSLEYLHTYPINRIKIAQQFVYEMADNPRGEPIVRATIGLAQALGIESIAEGVENPAQLNILRAAGCTAVQGYLFGRPVKAMRATQMLQRKKLDFSPVQPLHAVG